MLSRFASDEKTATRGVVHQLTLEPAELKFGQDLERLFKFIILSMTACWTVLHVIANDGLAFTLLAAKPMIARTGSD